MDVTVSGKKSGPRELGLRHKDWRVGQLEAVGAIERATTPTVIVEGPTGTGKTVMVLAVLRRALSRAFVLTPNISLQNQYLYEANGNAKMVVGRGNYTCPLPELDEQVAVERGVGGGLTVDLAPCSSGFKCPYKEYCSYFVDKGEALRSRISIHNYSYWLPESTYQKGFTGADWVVADEGHLLDGTNGILSKFGEVGISHSLIAFLDFCGIEAPRDRLNIEAWRDYGQRGMRETAAHVAKAGIGTVDRSRRLLIHMAVQRVAEVELGDRWVVEEGGSMKAIRLRPVWPPSAEKLLLENKGKRLMIVSATVGNVEMFARYLGIENYTFIKLPWVFPVEIRPVFYRPVGAVTWANRERVAPGLAAATVEIMGRRKGEKGVIHTQSFDLQNEVLKSIGDTSRILVHGQGSNRAEVIERFVKGPTDWWLMSPSVGHGEDFDCASSQIVYKMPFPDLSDKVVKIRLNHDPAWYKWETARELTQRIGRVTRREDGYGETYILDSKFDSVVNYMPEEVRDAIR